MLATILYLFQSSFHRYSLYPVQQAQGRRIQFPPRMKSKLMAMHLKDFDKCSLTENRQSFKHQQQLRKFTSENVAYAPH